MCGEKYRHGYRSGTQGGSPPHVRGKEHQPPTHDRCPGITPVCAGKSAAFPTFSSLKKDHPRMCGEKNIWVVDAITSTGSPPHVRGKALLNSSKNLFSRITPACAGKRLLQSFYDTRGWDHPRMCGEKADTAAACALCWGSPPHVRGKGFHRFRSRAVTRITPACAGKRYQIAITKKLDRDHPRMCGEKGSSSCR